MICIINITIWTDKYCIYIQQISILTNKYNTDE